jgi:magnesium-transporting ATPase (P-type)
VGRVRSIRDGVRERETYGSYQNMSLLTLWDLLSTGHQLWGVLFITNVKWNLFASLSTSNTTATNCIISYAQNTTLLQPIVFLTGIHQFLIASGDRLSQRKLPRSTTSSLVIISTMLRVEGPKIRSCSSIVFSFPDCPDSFLGPPSFLYIFGHQE